MDIIDRLSRRENWESFLEYRIEKRHIPAAEQKEWRNYIEEERYLPLANELGQGSFVPPLPKKAEISKSGSSKKRTIYTYPEGFSMLLKLCVWLLHEYDGVFRDNCYAFRTKRGAADAVRLLQRSGTERLYGFKADVSDYFNSIDAERLIGKLSFLREKDERLLALFEKMLRADAAIDRNGNVIREKHGAMAGIPTAPFFANVYLGDLDSRFSDRLYFRYSDDILIFAESPGERDEFAEELKQCLYEAGLKLNPDKTKLIAPGESYEFLGFSIEGDKVDISHAALEKMKAKIRRKARALSRWAAEKEIPPERGAKGFIKAMNRKFFSDEARDGFSWSRWFFPVITTDESLRLLDAHMQQYVRYCITGRHYKGNYRHSYDELKALGYRSLVHEYYAERKGR